MALLLISLYGLTLRVWQLASPSYWMDESFSIATAQALLAGDVTVRSPLYHLLLGLSGIISNWHIIGLRGLSALVGVTMICVGYRIAKRWFTVPIALVYATFLSLSTIDIAWSRQIRMYALLQLFFWLSLYCYQQWRTGKMHWLMPILTTTATILTHEFGWYVIVVFGWYELLHRTRRPAIWIILSLATIMIVSHLVIPTLPYVNYWFHYIYYIGSHYSIVVFLSCLGIYAIQKKHALLTQWFIVIYLGWVFCLSFVIPLLQYRYLFMVWPVLWTMAAVGAIWLWQQRWLGKVLLGIGLSILVWQQQLTIMPQTDYLLESDSPTVPFAYKTFTPQPNFAAAYAFLEQGYPDTIVATPYPIIHRLYTNTWPDYVAFVNLTGGTYPTIPDREPYSQLPYVAPNQLPHGVEMLLIVDQLAEYRLDQRWQSIVAQSEVLWEDQQPPWSTLRIYRIVTL